MTVAIPITASMIKELRARTGAGLLECKKTLGETGGDIDAAIEELRKKGIAGAEKKAGRIAAEGVIVLARDARAGVLAEVNCETDFVAKDATFNAYANAVAAAILAAAPADVAAAGALALEDGGTVESARQALIARIGENIGVRRFARVDAGGGSDDGGGTVSTYLHGTRIGVMVRLQGGEDGEADALGRDLAMHIAASSPLCISEQDMPAEALAREKAIFTAQAEESGKPAEIAQKMVAGRMKKFLKENTLLGQPFVKNPEQTVAQLLTANRATVERIVRFEVGEGLEKRSDDFVAEVMAQAGAPGSG